MRIHIIACSVLTRDICHYAAQSSHTSTITFLPQGLHETPAKLKETLQAAIDDVDHQFNAGMRKHKPDLIVIGYGLCSNGIAGVHANEIPLLIPKTDDCIALFLGSQKRYLEMFYQYKGTYWLNNGWVETAYIPSKELLEERRRQYAECYGEDNADYLLEQDNLWIKNYQFCGYIASPSLSIPENERLAKHISDLHGWEFMRVEGDDRMIRMLVNGEQNEEFLLCPPHATLEATFDADKLKAVSG